MLIRIAGFFVCCTHPSPFLSVHLALEDLLAKYMQAEQYGNYNCNH